MNISNEAKKILEIIVQYGPIRTVEIINKLNVSSKTVHKHLSNLLDEDLIVKTGSTPMVFYAVKTDAGSVDIFPQDKDDQVFNESLRTSAYPGL